jgi:hypothetical protein
MPNYCSVLRSQLEGRSGHCRVVSAISVALGNDSVLHGIWHRFRLVFDFGGPFRSPRGTLMRRIRQDAIEYVLNMTICDAVDMYAH